MDKVFIVSLPRSGTTSICVFFLERGFKVAHTAFDEAIIARADVVADTPAFVDYQKLFKQYENIKFVYLKRSLQLWVPSIRRLLTSMQKQWRKQGHVFELDIQRSFELVFPGFLTKQNYTDDFLTKSLNKHFNQVKEFCREQGAELVIVDIENRNAAKELVEFVCVDKTNVDLDNIALPHVNRGRRICYWQDLKHDNKVGPWP